MSKSQRNLKKAVHSVLLKPVSLSMPGGRILVRPQFLMIIMCLCIGFASTLAAEQDTSEWDQAISQWELLHASVLSDIEHENY